MVHRKPVVLFLAEKAQASVRVNGEVFPLELLSILRVGDPQIAADLFRRVPDVAVGRVQDPVRVGYSGTGEA